MNLHDKDREASVSLIKAALAPEHGVDQRHMLDKGDVPGHEFRGNQHTGGGGGKNGNSGTIRPKKWDGVEQLKAGHIVSLVGEGSYEHAVLESEDERGEMPRILVAAMGTGMSIAPTERVDRLFVKPAGFVTPPGMKSYADLKAVAEGKWKDGPPASTVQGKPTKEERLAHDTKAR